MNPNESAMPFEKWSEERLLSIATFTGNMRTIPIAHIRQCYAEIDRLKQELADDELYEAGLQKIIEAQATCDDCREVKAMRRAVEAAHKCMEEGLGKLFELCQPDKGDIFSAVDDCFMPLAKALRALDATPSASGEGWRTIDSAPKGPSVLIWAKGQEYPCEAYFASTGHWVWQNAYSIDFEPTHWMPLPPPPVQPGPQRKACTTHANPGHGAAIGCPACFEYVYPKPGPQIGEGER